MQTLFDLIPSLVKDGITEEIATEIFEFISAYFPILFVPKSKDGKEVFINFFQRAFDSLNDDIVFIIVFFLMYE